MESAEPLQEGAKLRIICAFRSRGGREGLCSRLESLGYAAVPVGSSVELIDAIVSESAELVLLDEALAGADPGSQLLEAIRQCGALGSEIPVVYFPVGATSPEIESQAHKFQVQLFPARKLTTHNLRSLVEHSLAGAEGAPTEGELLSLCERLRHRNPFTALGLTLAADDAQIRLTYDRLRRWVHPDGMAQSSSDLRRMARTAFEDLERAYARVSDPAERERLRAELDDEESTEPHTEEFGRETSRPLHERHFRRGQRLLEGQDWSGALAEFETAVDLAPAIGEYRSHLGWALYLVYGAEDSVLRKAIQHALIGLKQAPKSSQSALILGRLYQFTNRLDLAEKAFKRAVDLNADSIEAVRELRIMHQRKRSKRGKGLLSRLLKR